MDDEFEFAPSREEASAGGASSFVTADALTSSLNDIGATAARYFSSSLAGIASSFVTADALTSSLKDIGATTFLGTGMGSPLNDIGATAARYFSSSLAGIASSFVTADALTSSLKDIGATAAPWLGTSSPSAFGTSSLWDRRFISIDGDEALDGGSGTTGLEAEALLVLRRVMNRLDRIDERLDRLRPSDRLNQRALRWSLGFGMVTFWTADDEFRRVAQALARLIFE